MKFAGTLLLRELDSADAFQDTGGTAIADAATITSFASGDLAPILRGSTPSKIDATLIATTAGVAAALAGKQDTSTIAEVIRDTMGTALVQGANITITVNDAGDTITIAAAGGGETSQLPPRSGAWLASGSGANSAAIMGSSGRIFYVPLIVPASCTIDRIGIHVQTGDAGTNAKLGIYGSTAARLPGSLIAACASPVSTATGGAKEGTFSVNPTLAAGLYWLAWQTDSSGFTLQPKIIANSTLVWMENSLGTANYVGEIDIAAIEAGTYASGLPATAAAPTINLGGGWFSPCMSVRVA